MKLFKCIDFYYYGYYTNKVSKFEGTPLRTGAVFFCVKQRLFESKAAQKWRKKWNRLITGNQELTKESYVR